MMKPSFISATTTATSCHNELAGVAISNIVWTILIARSWRGIPIISDRAAIKMFTKLLGSYAAFSVAIGCISFLLCSYA
ncbi:hypothetical protein BJ508DRAFT_100873 [Ascobolus immersus RN42]|uniref:Uncharacterized protein n=1 Tax=Ascobolus immersus RN42 TaxID=1160509 RepID=A0A3N4I7P0_ASCIM|nr:hypothetical protein BJ508DRAFT_100873 [Ascobolus immersus RN42]